MNKFAKYAQSEKGRNRSKRYKVKNKDKVSAQNRAAYVFGEPQTCSVDGCGDVGERHHPDYRDAERIIWLCRKHHVERHGNGKAKRECHWAMCHKPHHAKGLCKMHYNRDRLTHITTTAPIF